MRLFMKLFFAAALAIASAAPALAETITVAANRTSVIGFYYTFSWFTCEYGSKPKVKITQPAHGHVTARWTAHKVGKEARSCHGRNMYGTLPTYTPNSGYHGTDTVKFLLSGSNLYPGATFGIGKGFRIDVNVK
jgi:hypothetical protein